MKHNLLRTRNTDTVTIFLLKGCLGCSKDLFLIWTARSTEVIRSSQAVVEKGFSVH